MKLIPESSAFDAINTALNFDTIDGCFIGRLESYSCKLVGQEKALYKKFSRCQGASMHDLQALSPPRCDLLASTPPCHLQLLCRSQSVPAPSDGAAGITAAGGSVPSTPSSTGGAVRGQSESDDDAAFAPEEDKIVRKTLFYLVSTLNAAFYPDYDFSNTSSKEFSKEHSLQHVMSVVERQLHVVSRSQLVPLTDTLWAAIDDAICLGECEIYTYNPDENSDPYSDDGCLWSFNYFFYNSRLKRVVFFTCRLVSSAGAEAAHSYDYYMDEDFDD